MEWLKKNFRQTILIALITATFSTLGAVGVFYIQRHQGQKDQVASVEYVRQQDSILNDRLCVQEEKSIRLENKLDTKVDKDDFEKLWLLTNEDHKILVNIALKLGANEKP